MKLETYTAETKEIFTEGHGINVTCNPWHNLEGCSIMVHSKADGGLALRMAGAFRWEELDVLLVALAAARAA
jgi:hypothetical protein